MERNASILELRLLKAGEVARILNVSRAHVYNLIAGGALPCVRIGESRRVRPEDLEVYIEENLNNSWNRMGLK